MYYKGHCLMYLYYRSKLKSYAVTLCCNVNNSYNQSIIFLIIIFNTNFNYWLTNDLILILYTIKTLSIETLDFYYFFFFFLPNLRLHSVQERIINQFLFKKGWTILEIVHTEAVMKMNGLQASCQNPDDERVLFFAVHKEQLFAKSLFNTPVEFPWLHE